MPLIGNFASLAIANAQGEDATPAPPALLDVSHVDDNTQASSAGGVFTHSAMAFGAADAARYILCAAGFVAGGGSNGQVTGMTIGGVAATLYDMQVGNHTNVGLRFGIALVPTGTTGTVAITWSPVPANCMIGLWRILNLGSVASSFQSGLKDPVIPVILGGGCLFGAAASWANAGNTRRFTGAHRVFPVLTSDHSPIADGHGAGFAFSGADTKFSRNPGNGDSGTDKKAVGWLVLSP